MSIDPITLDKLQLLGINSCPKTKKMNVMKSETVNIPYHLAAEQAVCLEKSYITDMSVRECGDSTKFAVALSSKACMVQTLTNNQFSVSSILKDHEKPITNIKFCNQSDNLLFTSSLDGKIRMWDLRKENCVKELKDESSIKPFSCFDVSCDDRFVCAGTELCGGDAFILFWDIRSRKLLGGYWESHTDDITQVTFHSGKSNLVATGSTDGLINIFDISESTEEDALQHSLNTESSVSRIRWHRDKLLSCLTHTEIVQLWTMDGAGPDVQFSRAQVAEALQRPTLDDCYVIDVHQHSNNDLFLLAGSNAGKGECLRLLDIKKNKLLHSTQIVGNRQIVRTSSYNENTKVLCTAGESGCICVWKPGEGSEKSSSGLKKLTKSRSKHKQKPY